MKFFAILLASLSLSSIAVAAQKTESCRIYDVNERNNIWEEGLGETGHPSSDSDSQYLEITTVNSRVVRIDLGQGGWSNKTDKITKKKNADGIEYLIVEDSGIAVKIQVYESGRGAVSVRKRANGSFGFVAKVDCSSIDALKKTHYDDKNARAFSHEEFLKLPKVVQQRLNSVDIPYEMGDGYYDLKELTYFKVFSKDGEFIGYIAKALMYYTEDQDEVTAYVLFDRNGLRFGDVIQD